MVYPMVLAAVTPHMVQVCQGLLLKLLADKNAGELQAPLAQCKCLEFGDRILDMELFNSLHETSPRGSIISVDFCHMSRSFVSFQ
jgi:hypothetical protein